jgi:hypothetical protein
MRSIQHTITTLLLTASVVGGAALLSGTRTQLEQFRRDVGEIQAVIGVVCGTGRNPTVRADLISGAHSIS